MKNIYSLIYLQKIKELKLFGMCFFQQNLTELSLQILGLS